MKTSIKGTITALATPFLKEAVDYTSLNRVVESQLKANVSGFVVHGTTGESPVTLKEEKRKIFETVKSMVPAGFPLIMGTGTYSTRESIELTKEAEKMGADAALVVVPYYNKPPQRGLFEHFVSIAGSVNIPIILYNVPTRTITGLEVETIKKLSEHPNIIGIKEASGDIEFAKKIRQACGQSFLLLSGDDATYESFCRAGGDGIISVASHVIPEAFNSKKIEKYTKLINLLFCEANPIPLKMALYLMQIIRSPEMRLPLVKLADNHTENLKAEMKSLGLIK